MARPQSNSTWGATAKVEWWRTAVSFRPSSVGVSSFQQNISSFAMLWSLYGILDDGKVKPSNSKNKE